MVDVRGGSTAIGDASRPLQRSLGIDVVLPRTPDCERLRNALNRMRQLAAERSTSRMRRLAR